MSGDGEGADRCAEALRLLLDGEQRASVRVCSQGMARLHTRTLEEMASQREEARKNAQAADKGKMTQNA
jgi:hypothetical protein